MDKLYYSESNVKNGLHKIIRELQQDSWSPDYIVGLTRGGLPVAVMLSHYLNKPMYALNASFRDGNSGPESNAWMAEDAFGYGYPPILKKNILIVDDINDTGKTFNWIIDDWQKSCLPDEPSWNNVWHENVRFAALVNNNSSEFKNVDYIGYEIDKAEDPCWCVFPWEVWYEF